MAVKMCQNDPKCEELVERYKKRCRGALRQACNIDQNPARCKLFKERYGGSKIPTDLPQAATDLRMKEEEIKYLVDKHEAYKELLKAGKAQEPAAEDQPPAEPRPIPQPAQPGQPASTTAVTPRPGGGVKVKKTDSEIDEKLAEHWIKNPTKKVIVRRLEGGGYVLYAIHKAYFYKEYCQNIPCGASGCYDYKEVQRNEDLETQMSAEAIADHAARVATMGGESQTVISNANHYMNNLEVRAYEACGPIEGVKGWSIQLFLGGWPEGRVPAGIRIQKAKPTPVPGK